MERSAEASMTSSDLQRAADIATELLATRWPGAKVVSVARIEGDASARSYLRCTIAPATGGKGTPAAVVVMLADGPALAMSSAEVGPFSERPPEESPFINIGRFLATLTDSVPAVLHSSPDGTALVVEDVGDLSLWHAAKRPGADVEGLFGRALETLATIQQGAASASPEQRSDCYAFAHRFDERLFAWELDHFIEYGLASPRQDELEACRLELTGLAQRLAAMPLALCHRDYHAWNIHLQNSRPRVFDFQDALVGPVMYDVASLLTDRTTPLIVDHGMEKRLVSGFYDRVGAAAGQSVQSALEDYRLLGFQRALKVVGRFNYLAEEKGKLSYLAMLPAIVATANRFAAEGGEFPATVELLGTRAKAGRTSDPSL